MGHPLRAHYSSCAFNYSCAATEWLILAGDFCIVSGRHLSHFIPLCPPSRCVPPPFVSSLPLCSSLCVLPPFVSFFSLCPSSLFVLPPFMSFFPLCPSSLCVLPPFLSIGEAEPVLLYLLVDVVVVLVSYTHPTWLPQVQLLL